MTRKPATIVFLVVVSLVVIAAWSWLKLAAGGFSARGICQTN